MHELGITQDMLALALEQAKKAEAKRIAQINLAIGEMSGISPDSVQFYFDSLSKGTIAGGATLSFRSISTSLRCQTCYAVFSPDESPSACPKCCSMDLEVTAGHEFHIESIEVK